MTALARFALNLPAEVDGDLPGGKWCDECGIFSNHIGAMHREDEREPDDDPEYRDDGGEC